MSDLLSIGRSGVLAYKGALAAVSENVTNADTAGYARRTVTLKEQSSAGGPLTSTRANTSFGGVQATDVQRVWDQYKAQDAWSASSDSSRAGTRAQYLSSVETMLGDGDAGVGTRLSAVFATGSQLAANPSDTAVRQTMLGAIGDAASAIGQTGANLAKIAGTVKTQATALVDQANGQLATLGRINVALHTAVAGSAARAQLEDQRDALIGSLADTAGLDVTLDGDGAASLKLNDYGGATLLAANDATPAYLTLQTAADGRIGLTLTRGGETASATPTGGTLAGLVDVSATIAGRRQQIDGLADRFATALNSWQAGGVTAAGVAGVPLLAGNTAATLALATSDPAAIAAASAPTATDPGAENGNLLALTALRGADGVEAGWKAMVTDQALQVASAKTEQTATATRKDGTAAALDESSGIDLDTEAAELMRFQQAYTASAKIIQAARETFQSILELF